MGADGPDMGSIQTTIYPNEEQHERWKRQAEEMDRSVSSWVADMVEAGQKKFDASVEPDETREEIRQERNDLRRDLEAARGRIRRLENHSDQERQAIEAFLETNPDATFGEVVEHVMRTAPERVRDHFDMMDVSAEAGDPVPGEGIVFGYFDGEEPEGAETEGWTKLQEW